VRLQGSGLARNLKPLRKRVRFADFTGSMDSTGFKEPVETRKEPRASEKRVGAIQVFAQGLAKQRTLVQADIDYQGIFDNVSFCQNPYFGRRTLRFQVSTAYKTKANKVRPVDPGETDGSKPGGCLDWLEKSKANDILCEPGLYSEWITPKFQIFAKALD